MRRGESSDLSLRALHRAPTQTLHLAARVHQESLQAWPGSCSWHAVGPCSFGEAEWPEGGHLPLLSLPQTHAEALRKWDREGWGQRGKYAAPVLTDRSWQWRTCLVSPIQSTTSDSLSAHHVSLDSVPLLKPWHFSEPQFPPQMWVERFSSSDTSGLFSKQNQVIYVLALSVLLLLLFIYPYITITEALSSVTMVTCA